MVKIRSKFSQNPVKIQLSASQNSDKIQLVSKSAAEIVYCPIASQFTTEYHQNNAFPGDLTKHEAMREMCVCVSTIGMLSLDWFKL